MHFGGQAIGSTIGTMQHTVATEHSPQREVSPARPASNSRTCPRSDLARVISLLRHMQHLGFRSFATRLVTQHLDDRCGHVRRPHADCAVGVAKGHHRIVRVMPHHIAVPQPGAVLGDKVPRAGVLQRLGPLGNSASHAPLNFRILPSYTVNEIGRLVSCPHFKYHTDPPTLRQDSALLDLNLEARLIYIYV